jgi:hypothetical protein
VTCCSSCSSGRTRASRHSFTMSTPPTVELERIPTGYAGTQRTVHRIGSLIRAGAKDFYVRQHAIDILISRLVPPKDYLGEIKALFEWTQRNIRYTRDPYKVELVHTARRMLELRAGDCDDMSIFLGALLESIGHPVRIVIAGANPLRPDQFSHVYLEVGCRGRWIALDPTMPFPMGWSPLSPVKRVFPLRRRSNMGQMDGFNQSVIAPTPRSGLRGIVRAIRSEGLQPRDPRVRRLWYLARSRGVLDDWLRNLLRRLWQNGLPAGNRPRTADRIATVIRSLIFSAAGPGVVPVPYGPYPYRLRRPYGRYRSYRPWRPYRPHRPYRQYRPAQPYRAYSPTIVRPAMSVRPAMTMTRDHRVSVPTFRRTGR